jgi:hypothetical protein
MANPFDQFDVATKAGNPFDQFDTPAKRERTTLEAVKDVGAGLVSGAGALTQLPGQIYGLATGDFSDTGLTKIGRELRETGEGMKSEELKRREAERAAKIKEAGKEGEFSAGLAAFKETVADPALLTNFIAEQAPNLIPGLAVARGLRLAGAGAKAATAGAVGTGATQQGADIGAETFKEMHKKLVDQGMPPEEATGRVLGFARAAGLEAAVISLGAQMLPGGRAIERAMAKTPIKGGRIISGIKGGAGEAVSEMIEEGGGKVAQNLAVQNVDPTRSLTEGLGETMGMAAVGGLGLGTAAGVVSRREAPEAEPKPEPTTEPPAGTAPPAEPPVEPAPPTEPGTPEPPPLPPASFAPPSDDAVAAMRNYWEGRPEDFGMSFSDIQNRDRSRPASIQQMNNIAQQPDYNRLSVSRDFGAGAPVVISDLQIDDSRLGRIDMVSASDGTQIPVQYAVVDARELTPSNRSDGSIVPEYAAPDFEGIRPVAGNGRVAGIQKMYSEGPYGTYVDALMNDAAHGVNSDAISQIEQPVLVRLMPKSSLTPDIADKSNVGGQLGMSPTEQAKIDMGRFDLQGIGFLADGSPSLNSVRQFVAAMPKEEQANLINKQGQPTPLARVRLANALFAKAYANDALIDLYAETTDPEAKQILNGMSIAAPAMSNLEGAGDYDIRQYVAKAAEMAVNARRQGVDLAAYVDQGDIEMDPLTREVVSMFAANKNAPRRIGDSLSTLAAEAQKAAEQATAEPDMFGTTAVQRPLEDVFTVLRGEPTVAAPVVEEQPEKQEYKIDKSTTQIAKEVDGMNVIQVADWLIANAPNSFAKIVAQAVRARVKAMQDRKVPMTFKVARGGRRRKDVYGSVTGYSYPDAKFDVVINGPNVPGQPNKPEGTNYRTLLHEMLHLATQGQIISKVSSNLAGPIDELEKLRKFLIKKVKEDQAKGIRIPPKLNTKQVLANVHELISYGMSEIEVQRYLADVDFKDKNAFTRFVDAIRRLLAISKTQQSALERLVSLSEETLAVPVEDIAKQFGTYGATYGVSTPEVAETRTPEFKSWSRDLPVYESAAEGENGRGVYRLYHATTADFNEFIPGGLSPQDSGRAIWLSPYPEHQAAFFRTGGKGRAYREGANVMPVYARLERPLVIDDKTMLEWARSAFASDSKEFPQLISDKARAEVLKDYDSIIFDGEALGWGENSNEFIVFESKQIKSTFNQRPTESPVITEERKAFADVPKNEEPKRNQDFLEEKWDKMRTGAPKEKPSSFDGVDDKLWEQLSKTFFPQNKNIVQKIDGMRDRFWQRLAQGVADQYRTIKNYSEEAYMKARMSKTIDGALEGILFNGEVKLTDGALDIAKDTKGLLKALEPVGMEVDRYQIWVALNRENAIYEKSRRAESQIDSLKLEIQRLTAERKAAGTAREANKINDQIEQIKKEITNLRSSIKGTSINPDVVAKRDQLSAGKIDGKSRLDVYQQVQKDMNRLNRSVLNIALKQGLINREAYDIYANDINYIPFYKVMDEGGDVQAAATKSGLVNQYFSKALKGGEKPFGDLMENTLRNWSHILSASMKNEAANATVQAAMDMGAAFPNLKAGLSWEDGKVVNKKTGELIGDGSLKPEYTSSDRKGLIKTMIDGKPAYFDANKDPLLLESIMSIGYMGPKSKFLDVARNFKNMLQFGVTISPAFKVRNLFRDSISAIGVSDLKRNPFANVIQGWIASNRDNPAHISALAGGAIFNFGSMYEGDQAKLIKRLIEQGVKGDTILNNDEKIASGLRAAWRAYQDLGNKSESANRMALYQQMRDKGMSHLEASFYARDLLDFSMQGAWPALRLLTQTIPFLNARVQGLYKLGRDGIVPTSRAVYSTVTGKDLWDTTTEEGRKAKLTDQQKAQQFSVVMVAVGLASLMLYMAFKDDEEFQKREQWDRDNFWWFKLPGMESALRIPKPFEIGAFGTMVERVAEQIFDKDVEGKVFKESLSRMLTDTFAINPVPQIFKPLLDLYSNKDSFTGAPIETAGMERLSKEQRIAEKTSPLAIALSKVTNVFLPEATEVSPVQADYAIKGYLGWLGGTASWASHYAVQPFSKSAYPDNNWTETLSMGFIKSLPTTQSKYVTAFYENNKQISQAYADMRHFAQLGEADKVQEILKEKGDKIAMAKFYDNASKDMSEIRKSIIAIRNDQNMPGDQKKEEIDRLKIIIGEIARQMESARIDVKKQFAASE